MYLDISVIYFDVSVICVQVRSIDVTILNRIFYSVVQSRVLFPVEMNCSIS